MSRGGIRGAFIMQWFVKTLISSPFVFPRLIGRLKRVETMGKKPKQGGCKPPCPDLTPPVSLSSAVKPTLRNRGPSGAFSRFYPGCFLNRHEPAPIFKISVFGGGPPLLSRTNRKNHAIVNIPIRVVGTLINPSALQFYPLPTN